MLNFSGEEHTSGNYLDEAVAVRFGISGWLAIIVGNSPRLASA